MNRKNIQWDDLNHLYLVKNLNTYEISKLKLCSQTTVNLLLALKLVPGFTKTSTLAQPDKNKTTIRPKIFFILCSFPSNVS